MSFPTMNNDMEIISKLGDEPNEDDGLSAAGLKAVFDTAGKLCKTAINKLVEALHSNSAAGNMGFLRSESVPADNVQDAINNVQSQIAGVSQGGVANNSVSTEKIVNSAVTNAKILKDDFLVDVTAAVGLVLESSNASETVNNLKFFYCKALGIVLVRGYVEVSPTVEQTRVIYRFTNYKPKQGENGEALFSTSENTMVTWVNNATYPGRLVIVENGSGIGETYGLSVLGWYFCEGA